MQNNPASANLCREVAFRDKESGMKRLIVVSLALVFCVAGFLRAQSPAPPPALASAPATKPAPVPGLNDGDVVAICGDSITEQKLYSVFIEDYLIMCHPRQKLRAMQFGWGGEVVGGFLGRMSNVLRFPVTAATTCYGMNDGGYGPLTPERAEKYKQGTRSIVDTFKKSGVRFIVVGSPGVVDSKTFRAHEPDADKVYNKTLAELRDIARDVAKEQGVAFADVHALMIDVMTKAKAKYGEDYPVAGGDGVHPNANGHMVMAYAFLKALGCDGNIGTITIDLAGNKADATDGHKIASAKDGVVEIESTRYPFCVSGDPRDPNATAGIVEFFPFNQDLNRLMLIVNNPGAEKLKVTWGTTTKEYPAAELAKGINLAADFPVNPFGEPFKKVEESIRAQQTFETLLIKDLLPHCAEYNKIMPEQKEALDKLMQGGIDKAKILNDAAIGAVAPVKHTIKIEKIGAPPAPAPVPAPAVAPAPAPAPASAPAPAPAAAPAPAPAPAAAPAAAPAPAK
jgi:lysophospholipase L1-like esterase